MYETAIFLALAFLLILALVAWRYKSLRSPKTEPGDEQLIEAPSFSKIKVREKSCERSAQLSNLAEPTVSIDNSAALLFHEQIPEGNKPALEHGSILNDALIVAESPTSQQFEIEPKSPQLEPRQAEEQQTKPSEIKPTRETSNGKTEIFSHSPPGTIKIIAWLKGQTWRVGVALEPMPPNASNADVTQGSTKLDFDFHTKRWLIIAPDTSIIFDAICTTGQVIPSPYPEPILLFRIGRDAQSACYSTANIGQGQFLLVVPQDWRRLDPSQYAPEAVSMPGYSAHYISISQSDTQIKFLKPDNSTLILKRAPLPELCGTILEAGMVDGIATYGSEPPQLYLQEADDWKAFSATKITDERGTCSTVEIELGSCYQKLALTDCEMGTYRIDFHDEAGRIKHSERFRFIRGLRAVRIDVPLPVPETDGTGHAQVPIRFKHSENTRVVYDKSENAMVAGGPDYSDYFIPNRKEHDLTWWRCENRGMAIHIPVLIERIWWQAEEEIEPVSTPLMFDRLDLTATSSTVLKIALPKNRWLSHLHVGFNEKSRRKYPVRVNDSFVKIPLKEFTDYREVQDFGIHDFFMWFEQSGIEYETIVARVSIGAKCKRCNQPAKSSIEMSEHLLSIHVNELFRPLSSAEFLQMSKRIPTSIYECSSCEHTLVFASGSSIQLLLDRHVDAGCVGTSANHQSLRLIADHSKMLEQLQCARACVVCASVFEGLDGISLSEHYLSVHRSNVLSITRSSSD